MADKKISELTAATTIASGDLVLIENAGGNSRKVTGSNAGKSLVMLGLRWARVRMTADDTAQNVTSETQITFDEAQVDTDSFWPGGSPTRVTVPSGVAVVELVGQVFLSSNTGDTGMVIRITHRNSADAIQRIMGSGLVEQSGTEHHMQVTTGPVPVSAGDYFTLGVRTESDNSVTIEGNEQRETYMTIKVVG